MTPTTFAEQNTVYAKDQPQYLPLPAHRSDDMHGVVTSCWKLTWRERLTVLWTGQVWLQNMTFHEPLQPIKPSVAKPL